MVCYRSIKKDKRYIDYIDKVSDEELAGDVHMGVVLDRIEARGEARGQNKMNQLILMLSMDGRMNDIIKSAENRIFRKSA